MFPTASRFERRLRYREIYRCLFSVIVASLFAFVYSAVFLSYRLHFPSSFDKIDIGNRFMDKVHNWRGRESQKSFEYLISKEASANLTTGSSDLDPLSLDSFRKKNSSVSWKVAEEVVVNYGCSQGKEDNVVPNYGHGTWIGEGVQVLNDTEEKLEERSLREERRVKRAIELMNGSSQEFENLAIQRSRSVDFARLGNYSIWKNVYQEGKNFKDILQLMQDQIIMARVYIRIAKMKKNLALHEELETQLAKLALDEEFTEIDQQQSRVLDTIREMGQILARANEQLYDCKLMTNMLRAMIQTAEDELVWTKTYKTFLNQLVSKSVPDAIHCLTMRLTLEYNLLPQKMRKFPNQWYLENPDLYHYALFTDNVLAASVVVNSTVMNAEDSSEHVFHIVTDKFNFGAMSMWFLLNPPGEATIEVQKFEDFAWLNSSYSPVLRQLESTPIKEFYFKTERSESPESGSENLKYKYPKYISMLNHLRFYIPKIYPELEKILFLDDDVVVQNDLTPLWSVDLKGNVNGAVETCGVTFHRLDMYLNFSDKRISENFDPKGCGWAFGMNIFDLKEWKKYNITENYHFWQNLNENRTLWKLGTLPPGLITFYDVTLPLKKKWHLTGMGYDEGINREKIEKAEVIHYNGHKKPWTEMGISKYKPYWKKYINLDNPYFFSCGLFD